MVGDGELPRDRSGRWPWPPVTTRWATSSCIRRPQPALHRRFHRRRHYRRTADPPVRLVRLRDVRCIDGHDPRRASSTRSPTTVVIPSVRRGSSSPTPSREGEWSAWSCRPTGRAISLDRTTTTSWPSSMPASTEGIDHYLGQLQVPGPCGQRSGHHPDAGHQRGLPGAPPVAITRCVMHMLGRRQRHPCHPGVRLRR